MLNNLQQLDPATADPSHIFIGTVVSVDDPLQLERIQVTIPLLYSSNDPNLLPWAGRIDGGLVKNSPGSGTFGLVPRVGSKVFVLLQDGNPLYPVYFASPQIQGDRIPEANVNYPNRYGWRDPAGNTFVVDTTPGQRTITITHASGASFAIDNSGNIEVTSPGNIAFNAAGNFSVTADRIDLN